MKILDSNILIYSAMPSYDYLRVYTRDPNNYAAALTKLEVLGFHNLQPIDKVYFDSIFIVLNIIYADDAVISKAIEIRRLKKISVGDSVIAATALIHDLELYTRNVSDFTHITGLRVVNPIL